MADDKQKNADFIGRVVSDAKNPPETRMLTGWFGDSGEEGYRRLYTDAELSSYVDIPDDAILYTEPLRDVQPAGGVIVWITRDAALKQGGSAASRAARFLQGQVQQDFASAGAAGSLEQAGLRCITVAPCGEPTGFTGECTKQPEVGGAWPCITAIPHCFEVTGFTGKCTHAPWPNPTRYIGCTYLHCPTHDLTHIPHICNIVATGNPGCVVINPPQGGDPAQKAGAAADAEAKPLPATEIPGCGYTKSWGVCETHLLGCGFTKEWGNQCPTQVPDCPTAAPGCGWSRNPICTDLPGCNWTKQPAICHQTVSQGMVPCTGPLPVDDVAAQRGAAAQPASIICATAIGCDITLFCHTRFQVQCFHSLVCPTQPVQCFPIPSPVCPVTQACPFGPGGGGDPAQRFAAFGAAAAPIVPNTQAPGCFVSGVVICQTPGCTVPVTSPEFKCTQSGPACTQTVPQTLCTQSGPQCPTSCGPECQSQQVNCTQVGQICGHDPCPSIGIACTALPPCPGPTIDPQQCPPTKLGPPCPTPQLDCTLGCTQVGTGCPGTPLPACNLPNIGAQAFAARAVGPRPLPLTPVGCPASDFVACSQFGGCQTIPKGDCTFFNCPSLPQQFAAAGPGGGCTQSGPLCHTYPRGDCTFFGCPTPGIDCTVVVCTHFGPQCPHPSLQGQLCPITVGSPQCPPPHSLQFQLCPITTGGPQCPPVSGGFQCPSALCQSIACQSIACQPGGGGEQQAFPRQANVPITQQTLALLCTQTGPQCPQTQALGCTQFGPQCNSALCPPPSQQGFCPPVTSGGPQCPPVSGTFRCPSALCQSIACQSVACQPEGGGQQAFQAFGAPQTLATVCTQVGVGCPHTHGCPTPGIDCTAPNLSDRGRRLHGGHLHARRSAVPAEHASPAMSGADSVVPHRGRAALPAPYVPGSCLSRADRRRPSLSSGQRLQLSFCRQLPEHRLRSEHRLRQCRLPAGRWWAAGGVWRAGRRGRPPYTDHRPVQSVADRRLPDAVDRPVPSVRDRCLSNAALHAPDHPVPSVAD